MAVLETFEDVIGNWVTTQDTDGDGAIERSDEQAQTGTYSAKCTSTTANDTAQVRVNINVAAGVDAYRWQNVQVYVPSATIDNLSGAEYLELAGLWPSGGGAFGWWLRLYANAAMYAHGYSENDQGEEIFNMYGTFPTDEWVELEFVLRTYNGGGVMRAFAVIVNGDFYGWYNRGNMAAETYDRVAAGILDTNSNDDLVVYLDQWQDMGTGTDTVGSDNRQTTEYIDKDYRNQDGRDWTIDWATWENTLVLDSTYGVYSDVAFGRIQAAFNHDECPSYADGWSMIEIGWPNGTPSDTSPDAFFGPMIAFHKNREGEANLEVVPYGNNDGTVDLYYESWPSLAGTLFATWALPEASIGGGSHIPEDGDKIFVRWEEKSATDLRVIVDYYDASTATWHNRVIDSTDDVSNEEGVDFMDADHEQITYTIDSEDYSIKRYRAGQFASAPRKRMAVKDGYLEIDTEVTGRS